MAEIFSWWMIGKKKITEFLYFDAYASCDENLLEFIVI